MSKRTFESFCSIPRIVLGGFSGETAADNLAIILPYEAMLLPLCGVAAESAADGRECSVKITKEEDPVDCLLDFGWLL